MGGWIDIGHEGFSGYMALPESGSGPGLLLLADAFGVDGLVRETADLYAEEGYVVLAPDLFWRMERRVSLDRTEPDRARSAGFLRRLDLHRVLQDTAVALARLRTSFECSGKLGVLGFGLGGKLAFLTAARADVDAAVGYDPAGVQDALDEAGAVSCPIALHIGETDEAIAGAAREAILASFTGRADVAVYTYPGCGHGFADRLRPGFDKAAALMAHSRSLSVFKQAIGPQYDLSALWEEHTRLEFGARDAEATMQTMVAEPYVNHIPTMTGGVGYQNLLRFYRDFFIPRTPADTRLIPISRTIGTDRIVDEMLFCFTHDIEIDWMLPGVAPTRRRVEIPLVAIVRFRGDKLYNEHIYWDQASVLVQIGLLDPRLLPVAGVATARKLLDESLPSNGLIRRWAEGG